ncbi:MAG: hypothetical protein GX129_12680 [Clostridiales bacterium]|jgi:hypothetical protein|nr:hypothetical protein [Clostridiales bacterium]
MNDNTYEIPRQRHKNLLIVEGKHEENDLFHIIFHAFPEIEITMEDIMIYGTNIYDLYNYIVREYGDYWYEDDVDLPFIVGKKIDHPITLNKKDFINVYLVFDYEHHDPKFCEQKIEHMQRYFYDSTDMGKLYLNYPMIESYKHFTCFPDNNFENLTVDVTLKPGSKYKDLVHDSYVDSLVKFPRKIMGLLYNHYNIRDIVDCKFYCDQLLEISNPDDLHENIKRIFNKALSEEDLNKSLKHFNALLSDKEHIKNYMSYYEHMRNILREIIVHNIKKASKIQSTYSNTSDYDELYELLDLNDILKEQNNVSKDVLLGYIWVLNTCIFIVPDYNIKLLQS